VIDCGQGNGASGTKVAIFSGCPQIGSADCNNVNYCAPLIKSTDGSCNNTQRSTNPGIAVDCVNINNGNVVSILGCLAARVAGGTSNNPCNSPNNPTCAWNHWTTRDVGAAGDPRAITMIITYPADLSAPNADVPIRTFATFYVTGWHVQGSIADCGVPGPGNPGANEPLPGSSTGQIWGHWVTYTDPGAGGSGDPCNFQAFGNCTAVLSR
jgi:hypothetical protein